MEVKENESKKEVKGSNSEVVNVFGDTKEDLKTLKINDLELLKDRTINQEKLKERAIEERKSEIVWKNRRKRLFGRIGIALAVVVGLGAIAGIGYNFLNLDFLGVDTGGPSVQYTYDRMADMHIDFKDIYNQEAYQYLVYFYADNCPHCHDIERTVCEYAVNGPVAVYFVEASDYTKPELLMDRKYLTDSEEKARNSVNSTSLDGFKFYAFPSMYFFKSEGEATSPTTSGPKTLMGVYIGSNEIPEILEANS